MAERPPSPLERILVVAAHPDDIDFGCSGSVATWTDEGVEVAYCIITDGDAGGSDRTQSRAEMARLRREEQTAAAGCVGVTDLAFLGHPDGRLESTLDVRRDIARVIRRVRPQRVVAPSPERNWQRIFASHPDHLAAGAATMAAVYPDSRNPFAFPELLEEGLEPHTVEEVWIMASRAPTPGWTSPTTSTARSPRSSATAARSGAGRTSPTRCASGDRRSPARAASPTAVSPRRSG